MFILLPQRFKKLLCEGPSARCLRKHIMGNCVRAVPTTTTWRNDLSYTMGGCSYLVYGCQTRRAVEVIDVS